MRGTSADDDDDIGVAEAKKSYLLCLSFLRNGASAYYANNFWYGVHDF